MLSQTKKSKSKKSLNNLATIIGGRGCEIALCRPTCTSPAGACQVITGVATCVCATTLGWYSSGDGGCNNRLCYNSKPFLSE
jgi:hypothetical protein